MARSMDTDDDETAPDDVVSVTVALGDGEWVTLTPVAETDLDPDEIEFDLDPAAKRLLLVRMRLAFEELDGRPWSPRRPLDG
jgi:hypothetical protein